MLRYLSLILVLSVGFCQNKVNVNNLVQYGNKWFKDNDDTPFSGIVFDISKQTGNKILEYKMLGGLKNGLYQEWSPDGILIKKGKYINDKQTGNWTEWYKNRQMSLEETYKDGKLNGIQKKFSKEGRITDQFLYKDGIRLKADSSILMLSGDTIHYRNKFNFAYNGSAYQLYKSGEKKAEGNIKGGLKHKSWIGYFKNGVKKYVGEYKEGYADGDWTGYHKNGVKKYEGVYKFGFMVGKWTYFNTKEVKVLEEYYFVCEEGCDKSHPSLGHLINEKRF